MSEENSNLGESNIDDFWEAIQDMVQNGSFMETPSPLESKVEEPETFNFNIFSPPDMANKIGAQQFIDNVFQNNNTFPLLTPVTDMRSPDERIIPSSTITSNTHNAEIAYLEAILKGSLQSVCSDNVNSRLSYDNEEEDEQDDHNILEIIANVDVKSEEMDPDYTELNPNHVSPMFYGYNNNEDDEEDGEDDNLLKIIADVDVKPGMDPVYIDSNELLMNIESKELNYISDQQLIQLSVRELNNVLAKVPKELKLKIKQRRRLLKNRGYAQKCRNRRLYSQQQYIDENGRLKRLLEEMTVERNMYKTKYENLKTVIRKAKLERERRRGLENGVAKF